MTNLLHFSPTRKSANRERKHSTGDIRSYLVPLLDEVRWRMVRDWRRGVSIRFLAKQYQLSVAETEAIIWAEVNGTGPTGSPRRAA